MPKVNLIDGNSIGFAAQNTTPLTTGDGSQTQAIFGFLRTLRASMNKFPEHKPVVLWDGKAQWRYDLYPGYKDRSGKSSKIDESRGQYQRQRPLIGKGLKHLGVTQVISMGAEADDLAFNLCERYESAGYQIVLTTGDKDWMQLINSNIIWYEHRSDKQRIVTEYNFFDETGYATTAGFIEGKALQGDSSDTIKGVGGIGEAGARNLIAEFGSVAALIAGIKRGEIILKKKALKDLVANAIPNRKGYDTPMLDAFNRNLKLMDLKRGPTIKIDDISVSRGIFDRDAFRDFCDNLFFRSIVADFDTWVKPFEEQQ